MPTAYNETVEKYTEFTKNNCDYAGLENSENQWLKKDNSYMASALRTAASLNSASEPTVKESSYYSLAELDTTQTMVNEIKEHTSNIEEYDSEEKIGLDLAMLSLKGEAFNKYSGVSASLITAVKNAINSYINSATEQLNAKLEKDREGIAEPEKMANLKKRIFFLYTTRLCRLIIRRMIFLNLFK
ncbi:MAG: hypothetical protein PHY44_07215 [Lachnospiraceae bacterium]|nr:hypothetical protein [Lachnospiraceae bacterium]